MENKEHQLSVFTPTYNRANLLKRAYESLKNQTNKNFIWLLVDDGSTDNTEELVNGWKKENVIEIQYIKKENGGKHTAYNVAVDSAKTELMLLCLDSDDYLKPDAVEIILENYNKNSDKVVGVATFMENEDGTVRIRKKSKKLDICSLKEAFVNDYIEGSIIFTMKTEYLKNFKFPVFEKEKFFVESYIHLQMDEPVLWIYKGTVVINLQQDGLTNNYRNLIIKNPNFCFLYNKLRLEICKKHKFKYAILYVAFGLDLKKKNIIKNSPNKFLTILAFLGGFLFSKYIKLKRRKI